MREEKISVKHLQTNYKIFGEGRPLLILHGWPSNSDRWQNIGEALSQHNFKVIIPDLPGFGKSESLKESWSLDTYVDWLNEFTDKIPELQKGFYLLGHSFGGSLSAKFTIKYNQKIQKLFLASASCIRENTEGKKIIGSIAKLIKLFSFIPYYDLFRRAVYKFILRKSDYIYVSGIMRETYLRVIKDDLSQRLGFVKVPTIIIWGDKDESTPIQDAHFIHEKIRNSKLLIIPGVGHDLDRHEHSELLIGKILENV